MLFGGPRSEAMRATSLSTLQAVACFAIAAAGLVPIFHQNRPFWGLTYVTLDNGLPTVYVVESGSPAGLAGMQVDDEFLTANGSTVDDRSLLKVLDGLKPGDTARLHIKRGEQEVDLSATGGEPPIAWIYYPSTWHPGAGCVALFLGLIVLAARPPRPVPRWLGAAVCVTGFGLAAIFYMAITSNDPMAYLPVRQYHYLNWGTRWHFEQSWVGLVAALLLGSLGVLQLLKQFRGQVAPHGSTTHPADKS
jgi:hypothetical protein